MWYMRLIFATVHPQQMDEVRPIGQKYNIDVVGLMDVGASLAINPTGETYEDNAKVKLKETLAALHSNTIDWVIAEDSGLSIDALGGEPGVHTSNWNGHNNASRDYADYLLERLAGIPYLQRTAHLVTCVAIGKNNTTPLTFSAQIDCTVLLQRDPDTPLTARSPLSQLLFLPETGKTLGMLEDLPLEQRTPTSLQKAFERAFRYLNDLQSLTGHFE